MITRLWMLLLVIVAGCMMDDANERAQSSRSSCVTIAKAVEAFKIKFGHLPVQLSDLVTPPDGGKRYLEGADSLLDSWGKPFQMDVSSENGQIELYTFTPQGQRVSSIKSKNQCD